MPTIKSREVKRQKGIQKSNTYTNKYSQSNYDNNNNDNTQLSKNNNKNWRSFGRKRKSFKKPRSNANGRNNRGPGSYTTISQNGFLLLGDSHVLRLNETKLLGKSIIAKGIGRLRSDQLISKHRGTINSELPENKTIIIHIGSNDIAKGVCPEKIASNVEFSLKKVQQTNSKFEVTISTIFLQGSDLAQNNLNISKTNLLLRELCYHQGWSF